MAEDSGTPVDILKLVAAEGDAELRAALARNPSAPLEILSALAADKDVRVRLAVAGQATAAKEILETLCHDYDASVRLLAQCTLEGANFESRLYEEGFICQDGTEARLGELLIVAGVLDQALLENSLEVSRQDQLPLGRVLIKYKRVDSDLVIQALKLQSLVRNKKLTLVSAEERLRRWSKPKKKLR
jgi:hypothetical protein